MLDVTGNGTDFTGPDAASSVPATATFSVLNVSVNNSAHLDSKSAIDNYLCVCPPTAPSNCQSMGWNSPYRKRYPARCKVASLNGHARAELACLISDATRHIISTNVHFTAQHERAKRSCRKVGLEGFASPAVSGGPNALLLVAVSVSVVSPRQVSNVRTCGTSIKRPPRECQH